LVFGLNLPTAIYEQKFVENYVAKGSQNCPNNMYEVITALTTG
jgi:hypothetical protein